MIATVCLLVTIILIIAFTYDYYVHHTRTGRLVDKIPGLKTIPIFGNILTAQISPGKFWKFLGTNADKYYPITRFWVFFLPVVFIRHPDDIEAILNKTKHIQKSSIYNLLRPMFEDGLVVSKGTKWHSRRKMLTPAFHFNILRQYVATLAEEGEQMTQKLKNVGDTIKIDVLQYVSEHTLNAICETTMGISLRNHDVGQKLYRKSTFRFLQLFAYRTLKPWLYSDLIYTLTSTGRSQKRLLENMNRFVEKVIEERKLYHKRTNNKYLQTFEDNCALETDDAEVHGSKKKPLSMLDLLIKVASENYLSDSDIREEVNNFMAAGYHTTAVSICYTLSLLAEHEDIQNRVREEINRVMDECDGKMTLSSLQNLSYLDRCLKESLRLYPPIPLISRVTGEDVQLHDSYVIPVKTMVFFNIYKVHRDPNFWPNPDVFDPDRFLPEKVRSRHPYSYIPFSAGPRNCIGQRFSMLEMKAMITPLIRNFYLEPIDYLKNVQLVINLTLRPKNAVNIKFVPIKPLEEIADSISVKSEGENSYNTFIV